MAPFYYIFYFHAANFAFSLAMGIVVSIILPIYLHKKNKNLTLCLHEDIKNNDRILREDSEKFVRIERVVEEYRKLMQSDKSSDIPGLIRAGIASLKNEDEAKDVIEKISNIQDQRNPLSDRKIVIEEIGILNFFQNITYNQYMIPGKLDEIINKLRNNIK